MQNIYMHNVMREANNAPMHLILFGFSANTTPCLLFALNNRESEMGYCIQEKKFSVELRNFYNIDIDLITSN